MPLYDYRCEGCGDFRAFGPMAEATSPRACPQCSRSSPRALTAPYLSGGEASSGWLTRPQHPGARGGSWRAACGLGCGHPNCR